MIWFGISDILYYIRWYLRTCRAYITENRFFQKRFRIFDCSLNKCLKQIEFSELRSTCEPNVEFIISYFIQKKNIRMWGESLFICLLAFNSRNRVFLQHIKFPNSLHHRSSYSELRYDIRTRCPRSSDPFYIVNYYIQWVSTFRTYSTSKSITKLIY